MLFQGLKRDIMLEDDKGLKLPAKTVFALAIRYLKDDLKKTCAKKMLLEGDLVDDDIHWVLTVPAIWNDQAKAFMREAAVQVRSNINSCIGILNHMRLLIFSG